MKATEKQGKRGWIYAPSGAKVYGIVKRILSRTGLGKFYAEFLIDGTAIPYIVVAKNIRIVKQKATG